jgi:hypothetical protein
MSTISGKVILKIGRKMRTLALQCRSLPWAGSNDGRRINGIATVSDRGDVKDRIKVRQRVITGVIAERAFHAKRFFWINISFNDEVGVGRDFKAVRAHFHQFDRLFSQITRQENSSTPSGSGAVAQKG